MNYLFFDSETTDSNVNYLSILQASFVLVDERFKELDRLDLKCRLRPTVIPSCSALLVNNVTVEEMTKSNLSHFEMMIQIENFLKKVQPFIMIGHNLIGFDRELLLRQLYKYLFPDIYLFNKLPNKAMDTLNITRAAKVINDKSLNCELSEKNSFLFKLESLCKMNNITHENSHSSIGDVIANIGLAKLVQNNSPDVWEAATKTAHKSDTEKFLQKNKIYSFVAYFYGRARLYCQTHLFNHPLYGWSISYDLRHDPEPLLKMGYGELQNAMKQSPKFLRTCKLNKSEVLLDKSYAMKEEPYNKISPDILEKRADMVRNNKQFLELAQTILADEAQSKKDNDQSKEDLLPEERIYADSFPSDHDKNLMTKFHSLKTWDDRIKLIDKFNDQKYNWFLKVLAYEEAPTLLPKGEYNEVHREFAKRLSSIDKERWTTFPMFYSECDMWREKFDKQGDAQKLELIDKYNEYVMELQKKFEAA